MARHRHVVSVRTDGLSAVLSPLLEHRWIIAATLVDAASGFVLDGYATDGTDVEQLGTGHAELARGAATIGGGARAGRWPGEVTVDSGDGRRHLLQPLADPHGDPLVLVVVVEGGARRARATRRRLRSVSADALTAGPSLRRRPVDGDWTAAFPPPPEPAPPPPAPEPGGGDLPADPHPPSAMIPRTAPDEP